MCNILNREGGHFDYIICKWSKSYIWIIFVIFSRRFSVFYSTKFIDDNDDKTYSYFTWWHIFGTRQLPFLWDIQIDEHLSHVSLRVLYDWLLPHHPCSQVSFRFLLQLPSLPSWTPNWVVDCVPIKNMKMLYNLK